MTVQFAKGVVLAILHEYKEIPEKIPEFPEIWHKSPEIPELSKWLGIAISMCIAQFNLYLLYFVVAILPITRPAIANHNLARFNPGINPGIPGLSKLNPEIPGLAKRSGIAFPRCHASDVEMTYVTYLLLTCWTLFTLSLATSQVMFIS